ncbi:ABC-three component system protein [Pseudoalteromonas spongiae]|uniref:ABC-three component system protein n=1 Tax=Pseudoalteromonas spongiae TaxID=298657 RepID=UPI000C2CFD22|nr:ABC-three component system protein [Pseudoalteromonas spongiae]
MEDNPFSDNTIRDVETDSGDIFIGNKQLNFNFEVPKVDSDSILKLVDEYKKISCESDEFRAIKEELEDYKKPRPNRDIIGLENKLMDGNRKDLIEEAKEYKDKFAKRLMRYEFSTHQTAIHLTLLGKIEERFNTYIVPLIKNGSENEKVDLAISTLIIQPLSQEVMAADPTLTAKQIRGMMYMMTGNCYLKWSKS